MDEPSGVSKITNVETEPTNLLRYLIKHFEDDQLILMNLATVDSEYGVLNRTVVYRGIVEDEKTGENILFITERNSRKYKNLKENPKVSVTFLFPEIVNEEGVAETWQARLFDAEAVECDENQLSSLWNKEYLFAKIRSHIAECGKPVDYDQFVERHDRLLELYKCGMTNLDRTKTFTVFKVLANRWDFYKSEKYKIGDRLQYRRKTYDCTENWQIMHVEP